VRARAGRSPVARFYRAHAMAKDTEKLIRQLSLISYLMAERRPVTALEIRRDVEGYSGMNEDAFARRFYADRAELDSLGIQLTVDKPLDGVAEQENYSLRPENFHLPPIAFSDEELASLQFALTLLDGEFAYAEPLRLALQQISWGRPSPLRAPDQRTLALGITGSAGGHDLSQRLAKIETAIFRHKTVTFDYFTMERGDVGSRKVDPYHLLFQGGQFYLLGWSHERKALRVFRLSRIQGKVAYATKAEHDFKRPSDFDPRAFANRAEWQYGDQAGVAKVWVSDRIGWQVERHFGRFGEVAPAERGVLFTTPFANTRQLVAWVLGLGEHARVEEPAELAAEVRERVELLARRHEGELALAPPAPRAEETDAAEPDPTANGNGRRDPTAIRPERFARLVTLASILIDAGRAGEKLRVEDVCERLQITEQELREDVNVLNVVNFGGGSYVLYAEVGDDGWVEIDPEPYSDNFARPARLLPVEAKALVAAIDLIGEHLPEGALQSAREKIVAALGADPTEQGLQIANAGGDDVSVARVVNEAIAGRRLLRLEYYKPSEDQFSERTVEPYALINGREGWYVASFDPERDDVRHFRLDRIKQAEVLDAGFEPRAEVDAAADVEGWPRTGEVPASRIARVWVSPERARWAREEMTVAEELSDGAVVVELPFAGTDWLARRVLAEAGDAAVLEPADAREAVREAVAKLR
jgi:predicted DNA-binding transcriptional regulator YafY